MSLSLLPPESIYYDSRKFVYNLPPNVIFVYGSNLKGIHGAGSAKTALMHFGAQLGISQGKRGQSYGLATCAVPGEGLSLTEIKENVERFRQYVEKNEHLYFYVTRVGCGYAGHQDKDIAPMFQGFTRCYFPDVWKQYLNPNNIPTTKGEEPNVI